MEVMLGRPVVRHSPARLGKAHSRSRQLLSSAMEEVHTNIPSTVTRANVAGADKEAMLRAIGFAKARKAGANIPKRKGY